MNQIDIKSLIIFFHYMMSSLKLDLSLVNIRIQDVLIITNSRLAKSLILAFR